MLVNDKLRNLHLKMEAGVRLPVICDTGKMVRLYNGAHFAFDADHGTVSTCFYSRESILAAIIAMRENAIENHKGN